MVREEESKLSPRSPRWFCWMSCWRGSSDCAKARDAAGVADRPPSRPRRLRRFFDGVRAVQIIWPAIYHAALLASTRGGDARAEGKPPRDRTAHAIARSRCPLLSAVGDE